MKVALNRELVPKVLPKQSMLGAVPIGQSVPQGESLGGRPLNPWVTSELGDPEWDRFLESTFRMVISSRLPCGRRRNP